MYKLNTSIYNKKRQTIQTASIKCTTVNHNAHTPIHTVIYVIMVNGEMLCRKNVFISKGEKIVLSDLIRSRQYLTILPTCLKR